LAPTIALTGRWRFGGFKAEIVASTSSFPIEGAFPLAGTEGRVTIQSPPIVMSSATVLKLPVNNSFLFMTVLLPWDY
jgi:hypothetical protein